MYRPARRNLVTDIAGLRVGHATDEIVRSGVTVLLCDGAWAAGVDVRGGGPGGRETDALAPENLVGRAQFLFFSIDAVHPWYEIWWWPLEIRWTRLLERIH